MKWHRQPQQLVDDGVVESEISRVSPSFKDVTQRRSPILVKILCCLPEAEYQIIKGKVWLFVPDGGVIGWNGRVPKNKTEIIYLDSSLEEGEPDDCRLAVAHEIL